MAKDLVTIRVTVLESLAYSGLPRQAYKYGSDWVYNGTTFVDSVTATMTDDEIMNYYGTGLIEIERLLEWSYDTFLDDVFGEAKEVALN